jgi:hypothetical protein
MEDVQLRAHLMSSDAYSSAACSLIRSDPRPSLRSRLYRAATAARSPSEPLAGACRHNGPSAILHIFSRSQKEIPRREEERAHVLSARKSRSLQSEDGFMLRLRNGKQGEHLGLLRHPCFCYGRRKKGIVPAQAELRPILAQGGH